MNCASVRLGTWVQNGFTVAKLGAIIIILIGGIVNLAKGMTEIRENYQYIQHIDISSIKLILY